MNSMKHSEADWRTHPGRNPRHVYGGYSRKVTVSIPTGGEPLRLTFIGRPRNPGRWIAHSHGARSVPRSAETRPGPRIEATLTRQLARAALRSKLKEDQRHLPKWKRLAWQQRSRRDA